MLTELERGEEMDSSTRRRFLKGMTVGAGNVLFSRTIHSAEFFGGAPGVPAAGNTHLLTLVAVNANTLRLRVIQSGKQGPAAETGIVPENGLSRLKSLAPDKSLGVTTRFMTSRVHGA